MRPIVSKSVLIRSRKRRGFYKIGYSSDHFNFNKFFIKWNINKINNFYLIMWYDFKLKELLLLKFYKVIIKRDINKNWIIYNIDSVLMDSVIIVNS